MGVVRIANKDEEESSSGLGTAEKQKRFGAGS